MTTVGRWSPNKVRERLLEDTWVFPNSGMILMRPTSIVVAGVGATASIGVNGSVTFTSATSLSLNGVFTSSYDNYMVAMRYNSLDAAGPGPATYARLRASGTDSTTGYTWQFVYANGTSVTGSRNTTENYVRIGQSDNTQRAGTTVYFYGPCLAQPTAVRSVSVSDFTSGTIIDYATTHSTSTAYDGLTFSTSGTSGFTGLVSVYGLGG